MLQELLSRAQAGLAVSDPTAIDVTPQEAWDILRADPAAQLIDVRTPPEWTFVGVPNLREAGKTLATLSWRTFPAFALNPDFVARLAAVFPEKNAPLFFLCRTGGRSLDAAHAMRAEGYSACFNIGGGFEGELDQHQHRGGKSGWKAASLPWEQN